jgi:hypothetical protein
MIDAAAGSLLASTDLIRRAALLVTNDSCPQPRVRDGHVP